MPTLLDDRIETVTPRTMAMFAARPLVAACAAALVALTLSPIWAAVWLSGVVASEAWTWIATRPQRSGRPATPLERKVYVASIVTMNLVWCGLGVLLWLQPAAAFKIAATCLLAAQIFHAQTFTAQSPVMLLVVGGFPALTLLGLAAGAGDFDGLERILLIGAVAILVAYTGRAAGVNAERDRQLEAARHEAVEARNAQARFLSVVGHEVRTPMTGVLGMAEALRISGLAPSQAKSVDFLISSGQALMSLLDDLLDLSKVEAGAFQLKPAPFESRRLCDQTEALWRPLAERKGLQFSCEFSSGFPETLHGDAGRIAQIVNNLVGNAIKFTSTGRIKVAFAWSDGELTITVEDTGPGLRQTDLTRIFQPFVQAESGAGLVTPHSSGLGLYLSRQLAGSMGGQVTVASKFGEGSAFSLHLPVDLPTSDLAEAVGELPRVKARVLVIEDHPVNRLVAETLLTELGCKVTVVGDGEAGLSAVSEASFDAIFLDLNLPGIDGADTVAAMRREKLIPETLPVIAITADPQSKRLTGFSAIVGKPLSAERLASVLTRALKG